MITQNLGIWGTIFSRGNQDIVFVHQKLIDLEEKINEYIIIVRKIYKELGDIQSQINIYGQS